MITTRTKNETLQFVTGPAGQLELITAEPLGEKRPIWGIVCHPHSLHGGSMYNKVVTTTVKAFQKLGAHTVRFNFRGVGQSEGQFDHGHGELDDLLAVVNWVLDAQPKYEIWLAGFSFGAYVAAQAATKIPLEKLVLIAPPVTHFAMDDLPPFLSPWILMQGDADEIVPAQAVYDWATARMPPPEIVQFKTATHFFHGQLIDFRERLIGALEKLK